MVKIIVNGISDVVSLLKKSKRVIDQNANVGVNKATFYVQGKVKESIARGTNAPVAVDTGAFLRSVDLASTKDEGIVFSDIHHAKYVEYGTSYMKSRPHFRNTAAKEEHKVKDIIEQEIKNI